jgi:monoterpene epsilon-lactone hydrolase
MMPSTESAALRAHYQATNALLAASPELPLPIMRALLDDVHRCASEPEGITYAEVDAAGRPALWCLPPDSAQHGAILYLHGGGFVLQSMHSHRKLAGHLARATGMRTLVLEYRLAPEHPFPAQIHDAQAAYDWLLDQGVATGQRVLAGDSAGANLAIATTLALRDRGAALPAGIIGLSPWVDLECNGPSLEANADVDALVQRPLVQQMTALYLGPTGSPTDPLANPLHADLTGLPPMYFTAGSHEALLDNAQRLAHRAREAGVEVSLDVVEGQQHVFPFMAGRAPEADASIAAAARWLHATLESAPAPASTVL